MADRDLEKHKIKDYEQFFESVKDFLTKENERKKRDNDYNPLLVIRSVGDEVRLHSRMLHSLLDPLGKHYQGALFLEPFLEKLDLAGWFVDIYKARVRAEYKHMDLYISDDDKHIIIENKIYADDGDKQIERYIDTLLNDNVECEDIAVVYLSVDEKEPKPYSLGKWEVKGDKEKYLICGDKKIVYRHITYKKEIVEWIQSCQERVKNITNLYVVLEFYKQCVKQITEGEKMSLEKLLNDKPEFIAIAAEIQRVRLEELSFKAFEQEFNNKPEFAEWKFIDKMKDSKVCGFCPQKYLNQCFQFMLTLEKTNFNRYLGFRLHINGEYAKDLPKRLKSIVETEGFRLNYWGWWFVDENGKDMVDLTNESLDEYFERLYKKVNALNDFLGEGERQSGSEVAQLASEVKNVSK